jgi:hypothetical protein
MTLASSLGVNLKLPVDCGTASHDSPQWVNKVKLGISKAAEVYIRIPRWFDLVKLGAQGQRICPSVPVH